jgi:hypothetical protein
MAKKLLDRLSDALRIKHCSCRTERSYPDWVRRFILYHGKRHPAVKTTVTLRRAQGKPTLTSSNAAWLSKACWIHGVRKLTCLNLVSVSGRFDTI